MSQDENHKKRGRAGPPPSKEGKPARNYVFTINFSTREKSDGTLAWPVVPRLLDLDLVPMCKYCIYSLEIGENGTHHFQGYIELNGVHRYSALHKCVGSGLERASFQVRRGSQADNIKYCSKDDETHLDGPWIWGEPARQGSRSDLLDIQIKLDNRASLKTIATDHFGSWTRYGRAFKEYKRIKSIKRSWKTCVWLIIGPSGRGKSNFADSMAKALGSTYKVPPKKGSGLYYDDYDGEDCMIIEEMNGDKMTPEFFNELTDRYECVIPSHGAAGSQFIAKHLFITTNYHPKFWWKKRNADQIYQTMRRINIIWKMGFAKPHVHERFQVFGPNINQPPKDKGELYE